MTTTTIIMNITLCANVRALKQWHLKKDAYFSFLTGEMMESDREQRKRWTIGRSRLTYYGSIADGGNLRRRGGGFGIFEDKIPAFRSMDGVEPSEGGFMRRNFLKDTTGRSLLWGVGVILFWKTVQWKIKSAEKCIFFQLKIFLPTYSYFHCLSTKRGWCVNVRPILCSILDLYQTPMAI